jgi:hypothetical protein
MPDMSTAVTEQFTYDCTYSLRYTVSAFSCPFYKMADMSVTCVADHVTFDNLELSSFPIAELTYLLHGAESLWS